MSTHTITGYNSVEVADAINKAFEADNGVTINGETPKSRWGRPVAHSYQNGTVSVEVPARTKKGATNTRYFKVGAEVRIEASR